jgi:hypothetical protein
MRNGVGTSTTTRPKRLFKRPSLDYDDVVAMSARERSATPPCRIPNVQRTGIGWNTIYKFDLFLQIG